MRIAIVGGGAAGLASAWLLEEQHDVTLFEAEDRLGGHAHTIEVDVDEKRLAIDAGFQFFAAGEHYATFDRLLDILSVPRTSYAASLTLHRSPDGRAIVLPPFRRGLPVWSSLTPRAVVSMLRLRRFLADVPSFLAQHDTTVTIAEYLARRRVPAAFVDDVLTPLLLAFWCVEPDDFRRFAAYNALHYLGANLPRGLHPPLQSEIAGGLKVYIDALAGSLVRADVRRGAAITGIAREPGGFVVTDAAGARHRFDQVVMATSAEQAAALLGPISALAERCRQLRRIEYFDTTIAIHGDRSFLPRSERAWSVVNARWDGAHSALTIWNPGLGLPVFKSWVTFDDALPEPLYATATYRHGMVTPDYFDAQRRLASLQGEHGLWLAGLYAADVDSHESAIRSAVTVAERLAPTSSRLALLRG